jgi:hypothetical protein
MMDAHVHKACAACVSLADTLVRAGLVARGPLLAGLRGPQLCGGGGAGAADGAAGASGVVRSERDDAARGLW